MRTVRYARRINHITIGDRIESRWLTTEVHSNAAFERSNPSAATKIGIRMTVRNLLGRENKTRQSAGSLYKRHVNTKGTPCQGQFAPSRSNFADFFAPPVKPARTVNSPMFRHGGTPPSLHLLEVASYYGWLPTGASGTLP
jgi:hypothetical protein